MSNDTTSFLGGAALAGLAAMMLLKGNGPATAPAVSPNQSLNPYQPMPTAPYNLPPGMYPPATPTPSSSISENDKQKENDQLRAQVEQQRLQIDQLKAQSSSQQAFIETLTAQNKANGIAVQNRPQGEGAIQSAQSNPMMNGLLMSALGVVILVFGGGIGLVAMFVLFARANSRPSRTIEVIHDEYPGYLASRRRPQALPARRVIKRAEAQEDFD